MPRFADERYAEQRQKGFAVLKFEPELETEYRNSYIALNANRLRLAYTVGIVAALSFVLLDLATFQMLPLFSHVVLLSVTIPSLAAPVAATWLNGAGETVQRYTFYCSLVLCVSVVVVVELGRAARPLFPYEALLLVVLYVYLVTGLLFLQATFVGWSVVALFVPIELWWAEPRQTLVYEVFYLVVANAIGMIGNYILQYDSRKAFLLQSELWLRAVQDPLTGALNRREFCNRLDIAWAVAQREKVPLGLMLVDLDQFKQVNDNYGHPAGDLALRAVAEALLACALRPLDAVGRYGGDEFIAVWYDVDSKWLEALAKDLPARVAACQLTGAASGIRPCISGGAVRAHPRPGLRPQDAIDLADCKLYQCKRAGGGTIATGVLAPPAAAV